MADKAERVNKLLSFTKSNSYNSFAIENDIRIVFIIQNKTKRRKKKKNCKKT